MSKESEQKIDNVFVYEDMELKNLQKQYAEIDESGIDLRIAQSEALLRSLGYELPSVNEVTALSDRKVLVVPSFDELSAKAQISVGNNSIEDLFTEEELKENAAAIKKLNHDYNMIHHLDKYDVIISAAAAILGAVVDIVLVGIPQKGPAGLEAGKLADYVRKNLTRSFLLRKWKSLLILKKVRFRLMHRIIAIRKLMWKGSRHITTGCCH